MTYVLGVDVGTNSIHCFAIDKQGKPLSSYSTVVKVLQPQPGYSEIDPEELWLGFKDAVSNTLTSGHLNPAEADCLGIACQRNAFLLWNRSTGKPLCNLITWQDRRAEEVCRQWNASRQFKFMHAGAGVMHFFTRSKRFLAASTISLTCQHVVPRLYWALNNIKGAKQLASEGNLCFGTVDTWMLWKLTNGAVHATDYSHVCTTILFDTYQMKYSDTMLSLMGFPRSMLPEIKDTGGLFGHVAEEHFGASILITGVISDQSSAAFAQGCWERGDLKCTLGTDMFMCINTGNKPHTSLSGIYPVVGWKIGKEVTFLAETNFPSSGSVCELGIKFGFYSEPSETEAIAESVEDSKGVYFVPDFNGIQAPYSTACVIGQTHNTSREHLVRAMLESIAFTFKHLYDDAESELDTEIQKIRVDGGVSSNNFVMQNVSNLLGREVERPIAVDMTVYGAIYVAGLASGFWKDQKEIRSLWKLDRTFSPKVPNSQERITLLASYKRWQRAVEESPEWCEQIERDGDKWTECRPDH